MSIFVKVRVFLGARPESQKLSTSYLVFFLFKSNDTVPLYEGILWRQPRKSEAVYL
jgi:hypothetical protein